MDDAGDVYVVGWTASQEGQGQSFCESCDAVVWKYDTDGNELWVRRFGSEGGDLAQAVAIGGEGDLYVAGFVGGALPGQTHLGVQDAFVRKYDSRGNELWTRQFGTAGDDHVRDVVLDSSGNLYLVGYTEGALAGEANPGGLDVFVRKYDGDGNDIWTLQFGTDRDDAALRAGLDASGNLYLVGFAEGAISGQTYSGLEDAFVRKYGPDGEELWTRQFGTEGHDLALGITVDHAGNPYVAGWVAGALPGQSYAGGQRDAYLRKYDTDGNELWTRQFSLATRDAASDVAFDGSANTYVIGNILIGTFELQPIDDSRLRKYDRDGKELWTRRFRSTFLKAVAVDSSGSLYLAGHAEVERQGPDALRATDAVLTKMPAR